MNDPIKKWRLAGDLLRGNRGASLEDCSLAAALGALGRRRRRRRFLQWGVPAAAAVFVAAAALIRPASPPEIVREESLPPSIVVRSRPPPDETILTSRPASHETTLGSRPAPEGMIPKKTDGARVVRTDRSRSPAIVVANRPSRRIELWDDRQLLAALSGRPIMLEQTSGGERRIRFLEDSDRQMLWEP